MGSVPRSSHVRFLLLFAACACGSLLFLSKASAATYYWVGSGSSTRWEDPMNWSTVPRGGHTVAQTNIPTTSDNAVLLSSGATVRIRSHVSLANLTITNSWTGSLLMGTGTLIVSSDVRMGSGTFVGGADFVRIAGNYTQTGGIVRGFQGTFSLSGSLTVRKATGSTHGSFTSTGTLILSGAADQNLTVGLNATFNPKHLLIRNTGGGTSDDIVVNMSGALTLAGALTITTGNLDLATNNEGITVAGGITLADNAQASLTTDGGYINASGSILINDAATFSMSGGTLRLEDDGPQLVDLDGQSIYNLDIYNNVYGSENDPVNAITFAGGPLLLSGSLTISQGRLDLDTNNLPFVTEKELTLYAGGRASFVTDADMYVSGNIAVGGDGMFTVSGGTLNLNGTRDQTISLHGEKLNSLVINNTGGGTDDDIIFPVASPLILSGSLTITQGNLDLERYGEPLTVEKGITLADNAQASLVTDANITASGTILVNDAAVFTVSGGTLTLNDDGDQSIDLNGPHLNGLTINNTGGGTNDDILFAGSQLLLSGSLTITLGNLDLDTNNTALVAEGSVSLAHNVQATLVTGSDVTVGGDFSCGNSAELTLSGGTLTLNGTASQTIDLNGIRINNLTINNSGTSPTNSVIISNSTAPLANAPLLISGALTITRGKLDLTTNTEPLTVERGITMANTSGATLSTNTAMTASGNIALGTDAAWTMSGTLILVGQAQTINLGGKSVSGLSVTSSDTTTLGGPLSVITTLEIATGATLAFGSYTLTASTATINNYGVLSQGTGKLIHLASEILVMNSLYTTRSLSLDAGNYAYLSVTDSDENENGTTIESISVAVTLTSGDSETVTLTETSKTSGIFHGSISTAKRAAIVGNSSMESARDTSLTLTFTDAQDLMAQQGGCIFTTGVSDTGNQGGGGGPIGGGGGGGGGGSLYVPKITPASLIPVVTPKPILQPRTQSLLRSAAQKQTALETQKERRRERLQIMIKQLRAKLLRK